MKTEQLKMWDDRFGKQEFAYGVEPNDYLKEQLEKLNKGNIFFPAEGEGRNAVYAAKQGWDVSAFDISKEGKRKADAWDSFSLLMPREVDLLQGFRFSQEKGRLPLSEAGSFFLVVERPSRSTAGRKPCATELRSQKPEFKMDV